jgi:hypothetical protein
MMIAAPVVVQVLEGEDAIARYRDMMGATDPKKAAAGANPQGLRAVDGRELRPRLGRAGDGDGRNRAMVLRRRDRGVAGSRLVAALRSPSFFKNALWSAAASARSIGRPEGRPSDDGLSTAPTKRRAA